ncbi:protein-L-isoaspartate O-methyltransferase family protein [Taklimakanibacter lacteus]|uniref:protein-L-isoaspartate O-methyltransferase family protein n=1 Tax=Taklimakanibacter lacteus TaxID=2268456 RepID=UPI0013C521CD
MTDFATARARMIVSQVRPNGITDGRILQAMAQLPRELFVPEARRAIAYVDEDVEIGSGRALMEPMALAKLVQLAEIGRDDRVLHVGCGTGYATALVASLCKSVVAIDEDQGFVDAASANLARLGIANAKVSKAAHASGWSTAQPYDAILIDGQVPAVPPALLQQLADGGRLVAVVGDNLVATATLYSRHDGAISSLPAFEASVARLPGVVVDRPGFVF